MRDTYAQLTYINYIIVEAWRQKSKFAKNG